MTVKYIWEQCERSRCVLKDQKLITKFLFFSLLYIFQVCLFAVCTTIPSIKCLTIFLLALCHHLLSGLPVSFWSSYCQFPSWKWKWFFKCRWIISFTAWSPPNNFHSLTVAVCSNKWLCSWNPNSCLQLQPPLLSHKTPLPLIFFQVLVEALSFPAPLSTSFCPLTWHGCVSNDICTNSSFFLEYIPHN